MIANQIALVRRELWEHRSIYVVPAVLGIVLVLAAVTGQVTIAAFGEHVDMALLGASNIGVNERGAGLSVLLTVFASLFVITMGFLFVFYSLDALYAERKDKSILFWRSMPVTDAETVISKLITTLIVIPLVTLAFIMLTQVLVLLVTSVWVAMRGANAWHLIWSAVPFVDIWSATLILVLSLSLWQAPFFGWFLLVSAYTKRSPMLMAFLPPVLLPMLERSIFGSNHLFDAMFIRTLRNPIISESEGIRIFSDKSFSEAAKEGISLVSMLDVSAFLTSPCLWSGLVVCGLFSAAAMYVRRFRDES